MLLPQGCVFCIYILPFKDPDVIVFVLSELSSEGDYWEHCLGPYDDGGPKGPPWCINYSLDPGEKGAHGKKSENLCQTVLFSCKYT